MRDRQLADPIAGPPPGLGMSGIEDLRPGQPQPINGDRLAVPFPGSRGWGGVQQTHYPAGAAVIHRAAAEPRLDPQRAAEGGIQLQVTVLDLAVDGDLHPGAVLGAAGCRGSRTRLYPAPHGPSHRKPGWRGTRGELGAGQDEAGDVVTDGSGTRRGQLALHPRSQRWTLPGCGFDGDLGCWRLVRRAVPAERGIDHMRAGQNLPGPTSAPTPTVLPCASSMRTANPLSGCSAIIGSRQPTAFPAESHHRHPRRAPRSDTLSLPRRHTALLSRVTVCRRSPRPPVGT